MHVCQHIAKPHVVCCAFFRGVKFSKMKIVEKYATEICEQVRNGASVSDVMQLLQDFENNNWISIDEYLPEFNKIVMVCQNSDESSLGVCRIESKTETEKGLSISWLEGKSGYTNWWYDVTHWRPLPNFESVAQHSI